MASSIWKGHLTFGLVSVPVKLVRAARAEKISFRQLHKETGMRVQQKLVVQAPFEEEEEAAEIEPAAKTAQASAEEPRRGGRASGPAPVSEMAPAPVSGEWKTREVSRADLVKGFEYEKDRYATLTTEELKTLQPKTSRNVEIVEFVDLSEVDPIYFETSYYVIPESAGERPYALLFESLRKSGLVAVAQMAMHNREHVVIIRAGRKGIILHTMFYETEIRRLDEYRTETSQVSEKELNLALMLVSALKAPFAPDKYRDTYREKVEELIQAKIQGKQVVEGSTAPPMAPVIDILEALKKSLETTAARKPPQSAEVSETQGSAAKPKRAKAKRG